MNTESVLSLRTFTKFSVFFPLVKVFFSFWVLYYFHCSSTFNCMLWYMCVNENLFMTMMALVGISASAV